jgi:hypothetical protein
MINEVFFFWQSVERRRLKQVFDCSPARNEHYNMEFERIRPA